MLDPALDKNPVRQRMHSTCTDQLTGTVPVNTALFRHAAKFVNLLPMRCLNIANGSLIAGFAHDEPDSQDEMARVQTRAERSGDGWVLNGVKSVSAQGYAAEVFVVSARTAGNAGEEAGISLFLIPRTAAGVTVIGTPMLDGSRVAELTLDWAKVDAGALPGADGDACPALERATGLGALALCAESLGAMEPPKNATLEYLRTRKQFGVPIGSFQALQHRMANSHLEIEQARSALTNAAAAIDGERIARERALSAAKASIGRIGTLVAEECIQLHGGIGTTWEQPLAHDAKRLIMIDHQLGDEDHHLQRYIAFGHLLDGQVAVV